MQAQINQDHHWNRERSRETASKLKYIYSVVFGGQAVIMGQRSIMFLFRPSQQAATCGHEFRSTLNTVWSCIAIELKATIRHPITWQHYTIAAVCRCIKRRLSCKRATFSGPPKHQQTRPSSEKSDSIKRTEKPARIIYIYVYRCTSVYIHARMKLAAAYNSSEKK